VTVPAPVWPASVFGSAPAIASGLPKFQLMLIGDGAVVVAVKPIGSP
jgi:hypothetical protein